MSFADSIAVNSGFTKGVVSGVWPELARRKDLQVVYPCVDTKEKKIDLDPVNVWTDRNILLSINRFERKKDIELAIKAFAGLGKHGRSGVRLVLAGMIYTSSLSMYSRLTFGFQVVTITVFQKTSFTIKISKS